MAAFALTLRPCLPVEPARRVESRAAATDAPSRHANMQGLPDDELLRRIARQDHDAFATLLDRHMQRVVSLAQNILGSAAEADEVAQDTFARLWTHPRKFRPEKALFTTWLHRVVVNRCIDRRRRRRFDELDAAIDQATPEPDLPQLMYVEQQRRVVQQNLQALPTRQRTALALFYMQELSQRDSAAAMELTESAFESLLHRARRTLATALKHLRADTGSGE